MNSERVHYADAVAQGYTVDEHVYPWYGYKGPRFGATQFVYVYTHFESWLMLRLLNHTLIPLERMVANWKEEEDGIVEIAKLTPVTKATVTFTEWCAVFDDTLQQELYYDYEEEYNAGKTPGQALLG